MWKRILGKNGRQHPTPTSDQTHGTATEGTLRDQLADIVYLIATHAAEAKQVIERSFRDGIFDDQGLNVKIGFDVCGDEKSGKQCDCWYNLEYSDFIHGKNVDTNVLKGICESIRRGICPHVSEDDQKVCSYVGMIHVAAGSENTNIVKLLIKLEKDVRYSLSACGLLPFHVALAKSCTGVLNFLVDLPYNWSVWSDLPVHSCTVQLAKRVKETGKVVSCPYIESSNITSFIHVMDAVSDDLIRKVIPLFVYRQWFCGLIKSLLASSNEQLAYRFLQASKRKHTEYGWYLIVYCVLLNAKDCLRFLLKRDFSIDEHLKYTGYNLLDIAHVFNSFDCFDLLQSSARLTDGLYQRISPYTFLIKFAAVTESMDTGLMTRLISNLHTLGHDINHQDKLRMSPLLHAIEYYKYEPVVIHKLLSVGADVDAKDWNGRSALYSALTSYNSPLGSNGVDKPKGLIKDILRYNPNVNCSSNQNAVHYAAEKDMRICSHLRYLTDVGVIKFKASLLEEHDEDVEANTYEERFIALSYVALLYEFGFRMNTKSLRYITQKTHLQVLSSYLTRMESMPRTLQSTCRIAIRQAYPGRQLHCVMQSIKLPKRIYDYVVNPNILKYVDIEGVECYGEKLTVNVDF